MNSAQRLRRDRSIEKLHLAGHDEESIGRRHGLHHTRVRTILVGRGLIKRDERVRDDIWEKSRDEQRLAVYERQRRGAREALALIMEGSST